MTDKIIKLHQEFKEYTEKNNICIVEDKSNEKDDAIFTKIKVDYDNNIFKIGILFKDGSVVLFVNLVKHYDETIEMYRRLTNLSSTYTYLSFLLSHNQVATKVTLDGTCIEELLASIVDSMIILIDEFVESENKDGE